MKNSDKIEANYELIYLITSVLSINKNLFTFLNTIVLAIANVKFSFYFV